ncbi:hypothetical protein OUZ56_023806 [Daphnia magna]|uniref:Uncharacterized protein n=1 Tax=Daphnia magna TaxID=35525 RepID=A0ABR0AZL1_9CRUS|nr:hypothetical protein OUZ56_023806 [Daphnia magna]
MLLLKNCLAVFQYGRQAHGRLQLHIQLKQDPCIRSCPTLSFGDKGLVLLQYAFDGVEFLIPSSRSSKDTKISIDDFRSFNAPITQIPLLLEFSKSLFMRFF